MFVIAILLTSIPTLFFGQSFSPWLYRALVVLVVSCSCSLVLSVPVAIVAGVGNAARHGVLVKGGVYMSPCTADIYHDRYQIWNRAFRKNA